MSTTAPQNTSSKHFISVGDEPSSQPLIEFGSFIRSNPDVTRLCDRAVRTTVQSLDATACRIERRIPNTDRLETVAEMNLAAGDRDQCFSVAIEGESAPFGELVVSVARAPMPTDFEFAKCLSGMVSSALRNAHHTRDIARHQSLATSVGEALIEMSRDGRIFSCNVIAESLFGYGRAELIGKHLSVLFHTDLASTALTLLDLAAGTASVGPIQTSVRRRDGSDVIVDLRMTPIVLPDGRPVAASLVARSLEDKQRSERALQMHGDILTHFPDVVMVWRLNDLDDPGSLRFVMTNRAGDEAAPFCHERPETYAAVARSGRSEQLGERIVRYADGSDHHFEVEAFALPDQCVGVVFHEVTERHHLTRQLQHAQRMELLGRVAGGIAHDFNNLLMVISGYSELLQRAIPKGGPSQSDLDQITKAAQSAQQLTTQLLAFGRRQVLHPKPLDLTTLVRSTRGMLGRLIGEDIQLAVIGQDPVVTIADPRQIEQVILNLAINARDAMPAGGKLVMEASMAYVPTPLKANPVEVPAGNYAVLTVSDTGLGMDPATAARAFEPFFTTKEAGKGTGLGLSTVYGILKQSHGYITVQSEPGEGTTFQIYLPAALTYETASTPQAVDPAIIGQAPCTVLVVEDSEQVRALVCEVLRGAGHTVIAAASPTEALRLTAGDTPAIDLLVTDVVMPQQSGSELAARLTLKFPRLQTLYMSGYPQVDAIGHRKLPAGAAFLHKPFLPAQLLQAIDRLRTQRPVPVASPSLDVVM